MILLVLVFFFIFLICLLLFSLSLTSIFFLSFLSFFRNMKDVDFNVDRFMKDMESVLMHKGLEDTGSDVDLEEDSDLDFGNFWNY